MFASCVYRPREPRTVAPLTPAVKLDCGASGRSKVAAAATCYSGPVDAIRAILDRDPRIAYALLFGSAARGTSHQESDLDVAIGFAAQVSFDSAETGALVADLEQATGRNVDLVFLHEAPPALAYRIFRDGVTVLDRDHRAFTERKVRAVLEYLDFRPLEDVAVRGVLAAAARGR